MTTRAEAIAEIQEQISNAGGLDTFKAAFNELSHTQSRNMNILRDLSRRAGTLETIADIAEKNWLSDPQITNIKNRMLITLAINISGRAQKAESEKRGKSYRKFPQKQPTTGQFEKILKNRIDYQPTQSRGKKGC